jgi:hypothetical protein
VLSLLGALLVRLLGWTYRVRVEGPPPPPDRPRIYAFHHGRQLGLFRHDRPRRVAVMSSLSRDGRLQARILRRLGFEVVDGSSSKGGARALAGLVRAVRRGLDAALAVDGPRGPRAEVKPGVVYLARRTGAAIVPICAGARRAVRFSRAWDDYLLPLPFSRVVVRRGEPIEIAPDTTRAEVEALRLGLQARLVELGAACDREAGS